MYRNLVIATMLLGSAFAYANGEPSPMLDSGRVDDAVKTLSQRVQTNSSDATAYNLLCRSYYAMERWDDAIRNCERAVSLQQKSEYQLWLGRAYGEKADSVGGLSAFGLARKAVASLEAAHNLDPNNVDAARDLGEFYASAPSVVGGGKDKARKLADALQVQHPADATWLRALTLAEDKKYAEAEAQYKFAAQQNGNSPASLLELARFYRRRKMWDQFDQTISQALKSPSATPLDRFNAGQQMVVAGRNLGDAVNALNAYLKSGKTKEEGPAFQAHYLIGEAYRKAGNANAAANEYRAALTLASNYRPALDALHNIQNR